MDRLRILDPRRHANDQNNNGTSSVTITTHNNNGNSPSHDQEQQSDARPKVSSLVWKFGGEKKKVPTYTFSSSDQTPPQQQQQQQQQYHHEQDINRNGSNNIQILSSNKVQNVPPNNVLTSAQMKSHIDQLEEKNIDLKQKLQEQTAQNDLQEKKFRELNNLYNTLQNRLGQDAHEHVKGEEEKRIWKQRTDALSQMVMRFCDIKVEQQQQHELKDIMTIFETKINQSKKAEQQNKALIESLKLKDQKINELMKEINEMATGNALRSTSSMSTSIRRIDSADDADSANLRLELCRTRTRLKEAQRELSSQNSLHSSGLIKQLSSTDILSSDTLISGLRKDINDMGWEIKNLQRSKESFKQDVEKLERELAVVEAAKQSIEDANALITRENKELRASIDELTDQNRMVLQNYQNHVKNYSIHQDVVTKLYDSVAQVEIENRLLQEKCGFLEEKLNIKQLSLVDKNEVEKLESKSRVLQLQYDYETARREHIERQLNRLQENVKQLQSELQYVEDKAKRADDQQKLAYRLCRDSKEECEILQLKIMDLEKRLNLTEKDKDIVEQELLLCQQRINATQYGIQRYQDAVINAENELDALSDGSFDEDVGSLNGGETILVKERTSHNVIRSQSEV